MLCIQTIKWININKQNHKIFCCLTGCYFTKFTRDMCAELNIRGWVKNSKNGTILGKMQGTKPEIQKM